MKTIREKLVELGQSLDRMANIDMHLARENAMDILEGVEGAEMKARIAKARGEAYKMAMEKVDDLRRLVESGNIG